jgi:protein SCO1/2
MSRNRLFFGAAFILVAVLLFALIRGPGSDNNRRPTTALKAGAFEPPRDAPDFKLTGSNGSDVTLRAQRGKLVLLTFGFTNCAAVCPTTLATLAQTRKALGKAAARVQVIFVTVDPDRDTSARLREYMAAFDPTFIGATGNSQTLAAVRRAYGVTATREGSRPDYAVAHTSSIFLIDGAGKLRAMMPFGRGPADFLHDISLLATN